MSKTIKLTDLSNYDSAITGGNNYTLTVVAKGTGVYTRSSKSGGVSYTGATKYSITFNIQNGSATTGSGHNYIYKLSQILVMHFHQFQILPIQIVPLQLEQNLVGTILQT